LSGHAALPDQGGQLERLVGLTRTLVVRVPAAFTDAIDYVSSTLARGTTTDLTHVIHLLIFYLIRVVSPKFPSADKQAELARIKKDIPGPPRTPFLGEGPSA
jgi:hypothetical protein